MLYYASSSNLQENSIQNMIEYAPELQSLLEADSVRNYNLESEHKIQLLEYYSGDIYNGYMIWDSDTMSILEVSTGKSPYDDYLNVSGVLLAYANGCYIVQDGSEVCFLDEFGNVCGEYTYKDDSIDACDILSGVSP